jgi:hypothetical protein
MDGIGDAIGEAIAGVFAHPIVGLGLRLIAAYIVLVWLAAALWAFVDMRRRTTNLLAAYASAAMIIVASPLLFPLAVIVHRIVRPDGLISERRLTELREMALEAEASGPRCPDCNRSVDEEWLICPTCRRTLGHRCQRCGRTAGIDWPACAWCGQELDGARLAMRARA